MFVSARPQSLQHRDQEVAKAVVTEFSSSRLPVRKHKKTRAQNRALFSTSQSLRFLQLLVLGMVQRDYENLAFSK